MKIQVLQENLNKALVNTSRFASIKAQLPVLSNLFFSAQKAKLLICATNLETSIAYAIGAQVKEDGDLTVPAKIISELVANLPSGPLTLETEKEHLKIISPKASAKVLGMNPSDFPKVPQTINKEGSFLIPPREFLSALGQVLFAVSVDETRPILTGVLFLFEKDTLSLVATDGFRLSLKKVNLPKSIKNQKIVLPKNVLLEVLRMGEEEETLFSYQEKENQVLFGFPNLVLASRVLQGEFPDFAKIIPKTSVYKVRVDTQEFLRAVKLSSVFAREAANIIKINLGKDSLEVSAESSQSGSQKTEVDARVDGGVKEFEIAFNFRFLEDFLHSVKGEEVNLEFSSPSSPGVFGDPKNTSYLHLIMPVKVQE